MVGDQSTKHDRAGSFLFLACLATLIAVPLVFSTSVYRVFVFPKFGALLVGTMVIIVALAILASSSRSRELFRPLVSRHVLLVLLMFVPVTLSTVFGVAPVATFWGSYSIQMGLASRFCFLVVFLALVVAIAGNEARLTRTLWVISGTSLVVALYACVQFVGRDPFLSARMYTFRMASGPVLRVASTLGHSNYLGNFLLYTTPMTVGLALSTSGRARRIASLTVALSIAAIAFSGTRGAWLGLAVGSIVFLALEFSRRGLSQLKWTRVKTMKSAGICALVLVAAGVVVFSPASRGIGIRVRSLARDRFTGSGRTLLWRDSLKMVADYSILGCGPEGFSKAFPAYKSTELAHSAPAIADESSHNSYLDAAISAGLAGAVLYIAAIVSALILLVKARRQSSGRRTRLVTTGLIGSFAAVITHNFFIYDQVPTGLYFFAFLALAFAAANTVPGAPVLTSAHEDEDRIKPKAALFKLLAAVGMLAVGAAIWYVISEARSERAIEDAFAAARAGDLDRVVEDVRLATASPDPTRPFNRLAVSAIARYLDATTGQPSTQAAEPSARVAELNQSRSRVAEIGIELGEAGARHSLSPAAEYSLMAYVALAIGDSDRVHRFAGEAIRFDPTYFSAHWLMSEAEFAGGNREDAVREAMRALALNANAYEADSVLARAEGRTSDLSPQLHGRIERARKLSEQGHGKKAILLLEHVTKTTGQACAQCYKELALLYEMENRLKEAVEEWLVYARLASDAAAREGVQDRIDNLKKSAR